MGTYDLLRCALLEIFFCNFVVLKIMDGYKVENIPKNPTKSMRATLACLFTCVCTAHLL